jgi:hypothetical protein
MLLDNGAVQVVNGPIKPAATVTQYHPNQRKVYAPCVNRGFLGSHPEPIPRAGLMLSLVRLVQISVHEH